MGPGSSILSVANRKKMFGNGFIRSARLQKLKHAVHVHAVLTTSIRDSIHTDGVPDFPEHTVYFLLNSSGHVFFHLYSQTRLCASRMVVVNRRGCCPLF